ncbi:MAG: putative phosphoribosyltransferase [Bryobacterales bacterium]|nr:putative phosphoribosyltransferase [Bryobacterales bacterium]
MFFKDRTEAGRVLGGILRAYAHNPEVLVLALPRGGVPVAFEVACTLGAPLDIFLVRKLGVPVQTELAMGAIASGGVRVLNHDVIGSFGISQEEIEAVSGREREELKRRAQAYRGNRPDVDVAGRTAILIDDGLATGSTMRAAVQALREQRPRKIVIAVPVAAAESLAALTREVDQVVSAYTPTPFFSVGRWYHDFSPTMDREIREILRRPMHKRLAAS